MDTPVEVAIERLVGERGMSEDDAQARNRKRSRCEERNAKADRVVDNGGDRNQLEANRRAVEVARTRPDSTA